MRNNLARREQDAANKNISLWGKICAIVFCFVFMVVIAYFSEDIEGFVDRIRDNMENGENDGSIDKTYEVIIQNKHKNKDKSA